MREVTRDDKWNEATDRDREKQMGDMDDSIDRLEEAELVSTGPSETELVTVALLMRLYDLGMAILTSMDEDKANQVFEAHEKGEHFNPPIFIPDATDEG